MPKAESVSINGVHGRGYAEIIERAGGLKDCRGRIEVDSSGAIQLLQEFTRLEDFKYTGVVYEGAKARTATFTVLFRRLPTAVPSSPPVTLHFHATGDPFAGRE